VFSRRRNEGAERISGDEGVAPDGARRDFLKYAATARRLGGRRDSRDHKIRHERRRGVATAAAATFPKVKVGSVGALQVNKPVSFNYPLDNEPNLLVKVDRRPREGRPRR